MHLGIAPDALAVIEKDYLHVERQRAEVIIRWQRNTVHQTWGTLATAVDKMGGYTNLVKKLWKLETTRSQGANEEAEVANSEKGTFSAS